VKLHILSDLHLEAQSFTLKPHPDADVIVLAGDITTQRSYDRFRTLLKQTDGKPTLYIPGNHEYYLNTFPLVDAELETLFHPFPNVIRLDRRPHELIDGIRFVGATLWTDFSLPFVHEGKTASNPELAKRLAAQGISDFHRITNFEPAHAVFSHMKARKHLRLYCDTDVPTVFITHFLPSPKSIDPQFAASELNPYFCSNCEDLMTPNIKLWIHGHTHSSCDYMVGETRVVCNPRGYTAKENPKFDSQLLVEVTP